MIGLALRSLKFHKGGFIASFIALFFGAFMGAMIAFYLDRTHKAQRGELPEDILTSDIDDGDPELGEFSPWSWWPIVLAASAGVFVVPIVETR